jgi:flagellar biosynthesis protein FlhF
VKVAKYKAANMREALAQAKRELGENAIILSTRELRRGVVGAGVEITAVTEVDDGGGGGNGSGEPAQSPAAPSGTKPPALAESDVERIMAPLRSELRALRSLLRTSPTDASGLLRQEMAELKRSIASLASGTTVPTSLQPSLAEIARDARLSAPSEGRVVTLVGPTGAGKTTTVAKLAARAALVRGHDVGLITLDDYRVGGEEQIRIFADLIPAPLHMVTNRMELARALHALQNCELIYIDTSGRSPRDTHAHAELASTLASVEGLEIHLVVPAPSGTTYIDDLAARYQTALPIDRLLFTKLDETDDLSQLVRAPARLGLPVAHVTMGQAVPEDLEDADDATLLAIAEHRDPRALGAS